LNVKVIRVILSEEANEQYEELNRVVGEEIKKGIKKSIHQQLLKSIKHKINLLRKNPQAGIHIPKKLIPKNYVRKYDINNLWKMNLSRYWRMIYTIRGRLR
jgi:hypothetical protein